EEAAAAVRGARQPRQGLLRSRGGRAVQPHRPRGRAVDAPQADPAEPPLAARAAPGPAGGGRAVRDLPRDAHRRGRLHLRRDRGAQRLRPRRVPALLLRPLPFPGDLRPVARRDHDDPDRRPVVPVQAPGRRALPDQPRLGGPASRRQPARLVRALRQRLARGDDPPHPLPDRGHPAEDPQGGPAPPAPPRSRRRLLAPPPPAPPRPARRPSLPFPPPPGGARAPSLGRGGGGGGGSPSSPPPAAPPPPPPPADSLPAGAVLQFVS